MKKQRPENTRRVEKQLEDLLLGGATALGWLLPETEDEVDATEQDQHLEELPPRLRDPFAVLSNAPLQPDSLEPGSPKVDDESVVGELARAAREGRGDLPTEIEERMRQDRERAESETEQ